MRKIEEKFLTGPQYINVLVIRLKSLECYLLVNLVFYEKLDFSFDISYCHMKIAPSMNTFDFF